MRAQATPELASLSSVSSGEAELPEGTKRNPISGRWFQKKDIFQKYGYVSLPEGGKSSKKRFWQFLVGGFNHQPVKNMVHCQLSFHIGLWVVRQTQICWNHVCLILFMSKTIGWFGGHNSFQGSKFIVVSSEGSGSLQKMSAVVDAGTIDRTWHGDNWEAAASGMAMACHGWKIAQTSRMFPSKLASLDSVPRCPFPQDLGAHVSPVCHVPPCLWDLQYV